MGGTVRCTGGNPPPCRPAATGTAECRVGLTGSGGVLQDETVNPYG